MKKINKIKADIFLAECQLSDRADRLLNDTDNLVTMTRIQVMFNEMTKAVTLIAFVRHGSVVYQRSSVHEFTDFIKNYMTHVNTLSNMLLKTIRNARESGGQRCSE